MANRTLKAAVIGCGAISETHIDAIVNNSLGEVTALCDINESRLQKAALRVPKAKLYTDFATLISETDADVIHICTPHYLHAPMTLASLAAGKDIYLEKPAAMDYEEGKLLLQAAEQAKRLVCVSFQNRLTNANRTAKELVDSGVYGKLLGIKGIVTWHREGAYYTESGWRGSWEREGGGVLMNQSIHTLDLLYYFGGKIKETQGSVSLRKNKGTIEVEDTAEATLWFESGATGIFYATNCNRIDSPVEVEIVLEKGTLVIREDVLYTREDGILVPVIHNDKLSVGKTCWGDGHRDMISHFYRAIKGEDSKYCTLADGLEVLKIIGDIYKTSPVNLKI